MWWYNRDFKSEDAMSNLSAGKQNRSLFTLYRNIGSTVSKVFWTVVIMGVFAILDAAPWREMKSFVLKKDEVVKIMVKSEGLERLLTFRWTLYTDKGLVVHESFDRIVGQHMLYVSHTNQSFRKRLLPAKRSERDVPYAVVVFKKFDDGNKTAQLDLLLIDKEKRIVLDYLTEK